MRDRVEPVSTGKREGSERPLVTLLRLEHQLEVHRTPLAITDRRSAFAPYDTRTTGDDSFFVVLVQRRRPWIRRDGRYQNVVSTMERPLGLVRAGARVTDDDRRRCEGGMTRLLRSVARDLRVFDDPDHRRAIHAGALHRIWKRGVLGEPARAIERGELVDDEE